MGKEAIEALNGNELSRNSHATYPRISAYAFIISSIRKVTNYT